GGVVWGGRGSALRVAENWQALPNRFLGLQLLARQEGGTGRRGICPSICLAFALGRLSGYNIGRLNRAETASF
ncbi:MAG: hypothetical protein JW918_18995, partial [Anaerolineae bacterium]|nr:hypothetical protein [Anaerolineae bacterium]